MSSENSNRKNDESNKRSRGVRKKVRMNGNQVRRLNGGKIEVCDGPLKYLAEDVDWDNLSPFEEWVVAVMEENDLIDDK